ncbi:MAG: hypothetical protein FGM32_01115 [Candidatus Kapabacteria bacterium]|nr:hypothetical protein [Candidatus Kapabacteria bacterium]
MPHSQLINDLLDGELDSAGEAALFGKLANDSELRAEFVQQLAIRTAIQQDRATLVPPISLTSAVFAGLGFAAPFAGVAGAGAVAQSGGMMSTWLAKIGIPILSALAAAGVTYTVMQTDQADVVGGQAPSSGYASQAAQQTPPEAGVAVSAETPAPAASPRVIERVTERIVERPSPINDRLVAENQDLRARLADATVQREQTPRNADITDDELIPIAPVDLNTTISVKRESQERVIGTMGVEPISPMFHTPSFSLSVRGLNGQSAPLSVPAQTGWYENVGIGMMYRLSPSSAVGLEVGAESFPMVFQGTRNQQVVQFELQPLATWAGISYRHVFPEIGTSGFSPFAQGLLGGTEFGPLGRASAGVLYAPAGPLSFMIGVEGTALAFNHQNRWFTASKYGLTYGVLVRL